MKQLAVISGKGGTGKTTVVSCFAYLADNTVMADCDVDAPNLHLALDSEVKQEKEFSGAKVAFVDKEKCNLCGKCKEVCRFQAIGDLIINNLRYLGVTNLKCEGCGACVYICPTQAIELMEEVTGKTFNSHTPQGKFSHALLDIGAEGSGKLVTEVRKNALALKDEEELMIIDGSPGIGCSVIASITGCNGVLAICEPTQSGLHDLERVIELAQHFSIPVFLAVNKYDLNEEITKQIESFAVKNDIRILGRIPFDPLVVKALQNGKPLVSYDDSPAAMIIKDMWRKIKMIMKEEEK